eukprot:UN30603
MTNAEGEKIYIPVTEFSDKVTLLEEKQTGRLHKRVIDSDLLTMNDDVANILKRWRKLQRMKKRKQKRNIGHSTSS